jgi:hypothetical protein
MEPPHKISLVILSAATPSERSESKGSGVEGLAVAALLRGVEVRATRKNFK